MGLSDLALPMGADAPRESPSTARVNSPLHAVLNCRERFVLSLGHERQRATFPLAHDDHDAALTGLMHRQRAVLAVLFVICRPDMAARVHAVDFDLAEGNLALRSRLPPPREASWKGRKPFSIGRSDRG
jgi:hypothetical protein